jgi:hypothetical protein
MIPLAEITEKYKNLPLNVIEETIEDAIGRALLIATGHNSTVRIEQDSIGIYLLVNGNQEPLAFKTIRKKLRRLITNTIEIELMKRDAVYEAEKLRSLQGACVTGVIEKITPDEVHVYISLRNGFRTLDIYGTCRKRDLSKSDLPTIKCGDVLQWYVRSVRPVTSRRKGRAYVRVALSRTAGVLPALLLTDLTGKRGISCKRRAAGVECFIESKEWLPVEAIRTVQKELKELVNVHVPKKTFCVA